MRDFRERHGWGHEWWKFITLQWRRHLWISKKIISLITLSVTTWKTKHEQRIHKGHPQTEVHSETSHVSPPGKQPLPWDVNRFLNGIYTSYKACYSSRDPVTQRAMFWFEACKDHRGPNTAYFLLWPKCWKAETYYSIYNSVSLRYFAFSFFMSFIHSFTHWFIHF